ncbi:MAG: GntR family transcriptional regulator [Clostridiales bacterium]|nr:GntR family transcriptional regulator [Candidatus Blautia equi]
MNQLIIFPKIHKESNREYAYRILRYNIMQLNLYPGETLNEGQISEQLKVSRTPVHEALILLQNQNLVTVIPQSGSHVSLISLKKINEGLFMRQTLEPPIYRQLSSCIPSEYLEEMRQIIVKTKETLERIPDEKAYNDLLELDDRFHSLAYIAAQKSTIWECLQTVCSHYDRIRYQGYLSGEDDPVTNFEEHKRLFHYLVVGDTPDFDMEAFYFQHISHFKKFFPAFYNAHPEYFTVE